MTDIEGEALKQGAVPEGYDEVVVLFIKFENPGDSIEGRLANKTQVTIRGSRVGKYTLIRLEDNMKVTFLGGVQLDELMASVPAGKIVKIIFTHKEQTGDEFAMKKFKVYSKD